QVGASRIRQGSLAGLAEPVAIGENLVDHLHTPAHGENGASVGGDAFNDYDVVRPAVFEQEPGDLVIGGNRSPGELRGALSYQDWSSSLVNQANRFRAFGGCEIAQHSTKAYGLFL